MADTSRYKLAIPNSPDFFVNDNATPDEQAAVFDNLSNNTGIVSHGYTGAEQDLGANVTPRNNDLVIDTNLITNPEIQVSPDLIPGGLGMPENYLMNMPDADGLWKGRPVWDYSPMEIINSLPIYQGSRTRMLDILNDVIDSNEYDFFLIGIPPNKEDSLISWKDTFRTQVSIPPESHLLMIMAYDITPGAGREAPPPTANPFRLQIFDDGAGEYLFDTPFNSNLVAGSEKNIGNSGNSFGPFILQSPLTVVAPGLLTITISNVNAATDTLDNPISAYISLLFATPKGAVEEAIKIGGKEYSKGINDMSIRGLVTQG